MKKIILTFGIISINILFSCHSNLQGNQESKTGEISSSNNTDLSEGRSMEKSSNPKPESDAFKSKQRDKKIIKSGYLNIKTSNISKSKSSFNTIVKNVDGYYELEKLYSDDYSTVYDIKIRVPSANFEKLLYEIESGKNEITDKNISGNDVTEEYYDLETRLVSKREYLKRYRVILTKANTIEEILLIEEKIREIEEEIDSKEGRLKFLADQVGFSTLSIHLYDKKVQKIIEFQEDGFFKKAGISLSHGLKSILNLFLWIISIWPYILIIMLTFNFAKRYLKK